MFSLRKKSGRLRITGAIVLTLGIIGAGIFYWNDVHRAAADNLDAVLDGYSRSSQHEMGVQMGTLGLIMLGWQETLARPITKALIIVAVTGLFASYFFRVAWVLDDDEKDERDERMRRQM